jgi:hypothetical protein
VLPEASVALHRSMFDSSADGVHLAWALLDEQPVHVSQTGEHPGAAYRCPECQQPVHARRGSIRRHSFAHHPGAAACPLQGGGESALHTNAKLYLRWVLQDAPHIRYVARCSGVRAGRPCAEASEREFASGWNEVAVERDVGELRGDVVLLQGGHVAGVLEVFVSHAVGARKAEEFSRLQVPWVEVDARWLLGIAAGASPWTAASPLVARAWGTQRWLCAACAAPTSPRTPGSPDAWRGVSQADADAAARFAAAQARDARRRNGTARWGYVIDYFGRGGDYRRYHFLLCEYDDPDEGPGAGVLRRHDQRWLDGWVIRTDAAEARRAAHGAVKRWIEWLTAYGDRVERTGWIDAARLCDGSLSSPRHRWDPDTRRWVPQQLGIEALVFTPCTPSPEPSRPAEIVQPSRRSPPRGWRRPAQIGGTLPAQLVHVWCRMSPTAHGWTVAGGWDGSGTEVSEGGYDALVIRERIGSALVVSLEQREQCSVFWVADWEPWDPG